MDNFLDSLVDYYRRVFFEATADQSVACLDRLDRSLLDYGIQSLDAIDRYLLEVHAAQDGIPTIAYANTIIGTAIYVGEVIRRNSPSTEFRWNRLQDLNDCAAATSMELNDLSDLVLHSSTMAVTISPTDPILERVQHGTLAPSVKDVALSAILRSWALSSDSS